MLMVLVKPPGNGTGYSVLRHKFPDIDAAIEVPRPNTFKRFRPRVIKKKKKKRCKKFDSQGQNLVLTVLCRCLLRAPPQIPRHRRGYRGTATHEVGPGWSHAASLPLAAIMQPSFLASLVPAWWESSHSQSTPCSATSFPTSTRRSRSLFFFFITLGLELSDTRGYEP